MMLRIWTSARCKTANRRLRNCSTPTRVRGFTGAGTESPGLCRRPCRARTYGNVALRRLEWINKTRAAVKDRLTKEIMNLDNWAQGVKAPGTSRQTQRSAQLPGGSAACR